MKNTFSTLLCVVLCVMLTMAALCVGSVRGWETERNAALHALSDGKELQTLLQNRAMDAANLSVVVARHLPAEDARLLQLQSLRRQLEDDQASLQALTDADLALTALAVSLGQELPQLPSVQASRRDQAYIAALTRTLSEATGIAETYTGQVADFDQRLTSSLTGRLAMLLGVEALGQ